MKSTSDKLVNLHTMKQFVNFNQELITYKEQNHQNSARPKAHTMNKESESKKLTEQKLPNATKLSKKSQEIMTNSQKDTNTKLKI